LMLLTGPAGSGKTTTIHACLMHLAAPGGRHIITVEDPVEQIIPGIMQTEVNEARGNPLGASLSSCWLRQGLGLGPKSGCGRPAMGGGPRGEHIARAGSVSNGRKRAARKPYEGGAAWVRVSTCGQGRASRVSIDTLGRGRFAVSATATTNRMRGAGEESSARHSVGSPGKGGSPREDPVVPALTALGAARDSCGGRSPEVGARRSGPRIRLRE
jgi:energy-coupling factor transporter ATP-binding protein EcfA2